MHIGDRLVSSAICLRLLDNFPFCIFPHFCWIVATRSDVQHNYLAEQLTVWNIIVFAVDCSYSWGGGGLYPVLVTTKEGMNSIRKSTEPSEGGLQVLHCVYRSFYC